MDITYSLTNADQTKPVLYYTVIGNLTWHDIFFASAMTELEASYIFLRTITGQTA